MYTCKLTLGLDTGTFQKKSARQFERIDYEHRARRDVLVCSSAFFFSFPSPVFAKPYEGLNWHGDSPFQKQPFAAMSSGKQMTGHFGQLHFDILLLSLSLPFP